MRTLLLLLLLAGCDAAVDPVPDEPDAAPTPAATPSPTATPAPAAEPDRREPVRRGTAQLDGFTFWGWSGDGTLYAFETHDPGPGAVSCEGAFDLFVVDASTDRFAKGGHVGLKHREPEPADGVCTPKDLAAAWAPQRDAALSAHGIVRGSGATPLAYTAGADPGTWTLSTPRGPVDLKFAVSSPGREAVMLDPAAGASYSLQLRQDHGAWRTVEPGTRKRETVHAYSLTDASAYLSPDGAHAALFVARTHLSYEGDRVTFMSNGVTLAAP
jgi:hypothetical protein